MTDRIKALSIQQPWAWLVAQGYKNVENRGWPTHHRGPVLIHASKRPDPRIADITAAIWERFGILIPDTLEYGGIVGMATIIDCTQRSDSPWFRGPYGFILRDASPLPFTPCTGQLGFFDPGLQVLNQLRPHLGAAPQGPDDGARLNRGHGEDPPRGSTAEAGREEQPITLSLTRDRADHLREILRYMDNELANRPFPDWEDRGVHAGVMETAADLLAELNRLLGDATPPAA